MAKVTDTQSQHPEDEAALQDARHYRFAGRRLEDAIPPSQKILVGALRHAVDKRSAHPVITLDGKRYMIGNATSLVDPSDLEDPIKHEAAMEKLGKCYLLPYYEREDHAFLRQEKRMVQSRVSRFFELAQPGIRNEKSAPEILALIDAYRTDKQKGAMLVGAIMDHLEALSLTIIDVSKLNPKFADTTDPAYKELVQEFRFFYNFVCYGEKLAYMQSGWDKKPEHCPEPPIDADTLMNSVRLADGSPDRDGLFSYYAREIGKIVSVETGSQYHSMDSDDLKAARKTMEKISREAVTRYVALACGAIDHVHDSLGHYVLGNHQFQSIIRDHRTDLPIFNKEGLSAANYQFLLDDFATKARARTCIRLKDSSFFKAADAEFTEAAQRLNDANEAILSLPELPNAVKDGVELSQRGINLIGNMAQTRLPRDHNAPAFDKDKGKKLSSVAILEADLQKWSARSARMNAAAACAYTAKEVRPKPKAPWQQRMETLLANHNNAAGVGRG